MPDNTYVQVAVIALAAYAVGATPFGVIIARIKGVDLQGRGSGNVGATNVSRVIGRSYGVLCFVLDVAKGLVPTLVVGTIVGGDGVPSPAAQALWLAAGLGCICGHVFSFYLKFRGGKGVATSLGVVMGIFPYFTYAGLAALAVWLVVTGVSRFVSLGSIVAAAAFVPLFAGISHFCLDTSPLALWPLGVFATAMALLIILRHRTNIHRLLRHNEPRIGSERPMAGSP